MNVKVIQVLDAVTFLEFLCALDGDSEYMLYSIGERRVSTHDLRGHLKSLKKNSVILGAFDKDKIVGYLAVYGERQKRCEHVGRLACGVLKNYRRKGIANGLWESFLV
jgi:ribosomal protein S18 acetylase RimI-like enzyme